MFPSASQIIRFPHILACYIFVIIDSGIFWCGKSKLCQTFAENADVFSQISIPEKPFWGAPSWRRDLWLCFPLWGPAPWLFVASTVAPFESKSSAAATWPRRTASWSGVEPQAVSQAATAKMPTARDDESCGNAQLHPFNRQTNDECFGLNIFTTCSKQNTCTNTPNALSVKESSK